MKKKLPKQIFVKWDGDDPPYLDARATPQGYDDGDKIGVYQLVEEKTMKITEELV